MHQRSELIVLRKKLETLRDKYQKKLIINKQKQMIIVKRKQKTISETH